MRARFPERYTEASGWRVVPLPVHETRVAHLRPTLLLIFAAVAGVLLIAAANVSGLLLARATTRRREASVRAALGATRWRLMRQLLTETSLLATLAGALGLLLARIAVTLLERVDRVTLPRAQPIQIDAPVATFMFVATLAAALICGLAPAWHTTRGNALGWLRSAGRTTGVGREASWLWRPLVVTQTALALTLLVGAGLLGRSLAALYDVAPGYRSNNVLAARIALPVVPYRERPARVRFIETVLEWLNGHADVHAAAAVSSLPLGGATNSGTFHIQGRVSTPGQPLPHAESWAATPRYFRTLGIPLLRGRLFHAGDHAQAGRVVIVNQALVRKYFPGQDPVGQRIDIEGTPNAPRWREIVGVVGDVRDRSLDQQAKPQLYAPYAQRPFFGTFLVLHTGGDPWALLPVVRAAVRAADPDLPIYGATTIPRLMDASARNRAVATWALSCFAAVALFLAALGLYGLLAHRVRERHTEIGLRMALGACSSHLVRAFLGDGARLVAWGLAAGVLLALAATRLLSTLVFGVTNADLPTYAAVAVGLAGVTLATCALPAWRATRVDPLTALRTE